MIGSIKGSVGYLGPDFCLIETAGGVGYRIFMPAAHLAQLALGAQVMVHTHTAVREDAILLYGFLSQEYYNLFELLLGVSGVGPKMALGILSAIKPDAFYLAVQSRDVKTLTKLPGIGKKTAQRIALELKEKITDDEVNALPQGMAATAQAAHRRDDPVAEAMIALQSLGYSQGEAMQALSAVKDKSDQSDELVRLALRGMM